MKGKLNLKDLQMDLGIHSPVVNTNSQITHIQFCIIYTFVTTPEMLSSNYWSALKGWAPGSGLSTVHKSNTSRSRSSTKPLTLYDFLTINMLILFCFLILKILHSIRNMFARTYYTHTQLVTLWAVWFWRSLENEKIMTINIFKFRMSGVSNNRVRCDFLKLPVGWLFCLKAVLCCSQDIKIQLLTTVFVFQDKILFNHLFSGKWPRLREQHILCPNNTV